MDVPRTVLLALASCWLLVVGASVGSFLNVVIYRLPAGLSVLRPRSRCPRCLTPILMRDNVPIFGWLLLGGRCRACGAAISPRYPLVELATALLFVVLAWSGPFEWGSVSGDFDELFLDGALSWGRYAYQLVLVSSLLAAALTACDGHPVSRRLFWPPLAIGLLSPLFWPELRCLPAIECSWAAPLPGTLRALVDGAAGLALATLAGGLVRRAIGASLLPRRWLPAAQAAPAADAELDTAAVWLWIGAFLGWQLAAIIVAATAALVALAVRWKAVPAMFWSLVTTVALLMVQDPLGRMGLSRGLAATLALSVLPPLAAAALFRLAWKCRPARLN